MRMKKVSILASIMMVVLASVLATAGTMAWFSDTETVSVGDIQAGTLNLQVGANDPCTVHIRIHNIAPGWSETFDWILTNTGSISGTLSIEVSPITNKENLRYEPEIVAGDTTPNVGELGANIRVTYAKVMDVDWRGQISAQITKNLGGCCLNDFSGTYDDLKAERLSLIHI